MRKSGRWLCGWYGIEVEACVETLEKGAESALLYHPDFISCKQCKLNRD